jgi:pimeloyl-ACP methyl ester carboxylesterase
MTAPCETSRLPPAGAPQRRRGVGLVAPSWVDSSEYPFVTKRFLTEDGAISYIDVGDGDPTVFVHGTPSWSFEWRAVIAKLAGARRCIAIDHLGFGLSDKPPAAPLRPEDHARRLEQLIRALDLRNITLVLHDFGGPVGAQVALQMPERVRRIVVVNSWLWPNGDEPALRRLDRVLRSWVGKVLYRWLNVSPRLLLPAAMARRPRRATHRHYLEPFARRSSREGPYQMALGLVGSDPFHGQLWARRTTLTPWVTDIVWGSRDPALTARHLARWVEAFPSARVHALPNVGHIVAEESHETPKSHLTRSQGCSSSTRAWPGRLNPLELWRRQASMRTEW